MTSNGVTLDKCIQPSVDFTGKITGLVAGDEESYTVSHKVVELLHMQTCGTTLYGFAICTIPYPILYGFVSNGKILIYYICSYIYHTKIKLKYTWKISSKTWQILFGVGIFYRLIFCTQLRPDMTAEITYFEKNILQMFFLRIPIALYVNFYNDYMPLNHFYS